MDEEVELDVEGVDDDGSSSASLHIDPNELPSSSSHLSLDVPEHPWLMFDDNFSEHIPAITLPPDMDPSSRATIEQMILEEHSYLHKNKQRKKNTAAKSSPITTQASSHVGEKGVSYNKWTQEEKQLFQKGIEEHGHNWEEIATMIKRKSIQQVKNFATRHYLQNKTIAAAELSYDAQDQLPSDECPLSMPLDVKGHQHALTGVMGVTMVTDAEIRHHEQTYQSRVEEEEEDLEVDVEENSEDETSQPSLQSAVLFGDILKTAEGHPATDCSMEAGKVKGEKGSKALTSSPLQSTTHCTRLKDVKVREEMQNPEDGVSLSDASSIKTTLHKSESFQEREKSKTDIGIENKDELQTDCPKEAGKDSTANNGHFESKSVFRGQRGDQSNASISGKSSSTSEKRRRSSSGDDTERTDCSKAQTLSPVFCFETTSISSLPGNKISEYITTSQKKQPGGCQRYDKGDGSDADESDFVSSTTLREKRTTLRKRSAKGEISTSHMSATEEKTVTSNSSNTQDLCMSSNQKEKSVERSDHNHHVYASGDENSTQLPKVVRNAKQGESNPITESDESDLCRTNRGLEVRDNPLTEEICPGGKDSDDCNKSQSGECLPKGDDVSSFTSKDSSSEDRTDTVSCPEKIVEEVGDTLRVDGDVEVEDSLNDGGQQDWTGGGGHQDWTGEEDEREEEEDSPTNTLPEREISLDEGVITEGEKKAMPEFFDYTSSAKTPERYLTIRNHIIKCWQRSKPEYLTKTYARNGLRKSGDVNVIGQIHGYLETVGAINFGTNPSYRVRLKKRRSSKEIWSQQSSDAGAKARRLESMRPRRPMAGKKTEVDLQEPTEQVSHREPKQKKVKQPRPPAYDPFKLVQCSQFSTDLPAPFSVKISGDVMVTMDLHSHLSTTEVIGLLGGQFDATTCELDMKMAKPCKSLSTGMQCEMDPVSQTEACLAIQESGCSVIGWYHSHPTFAPNPSIRDIETQTDFQEWFSQDGERPFIGVIVSPYHSRQHVHSKVNCITVSRQWSSNGHTWKPYKFDFSIYQSDQVEESHQKLVSLASSLIDEFAEYKYRVEMLWVCPGQTDMTYLEKMLRSLEANLCGEEETKRETVGKLRQLVLHRFESKCSTHITDAVTHITHIPAHITDTPTHFTDTTMD